MIQLWKTFLENINLLKIIVDLKNISGHCWIVIVNNYLRSIREHQKWKGAYSNDASREPLDLTQEKTFWDRNIFKKYVSATVVDEAHCVDQWYRQFYYYLLLILQCHCRSLKYELKKRVSSTICEIICINIINLEIFRF